MSRTYTAPRNSTGKESLWSTLPLLPFGGEGNGGYNTEGDVLPRVTATSDGVDLNRIWDQMQQVLQVWNNSRSALVDVLSFWTTSVGDAVSQGVSDNLFEKASELGEPTGLRPPSEHKLLGYQFEDFDRAARYTWKFLRSADARQVRAIHNEALNMDNRLVTTTILNRLFNPATETNPEGLTCYGLWTGTDGMTPPAFNGHMFAADHSHYQTTGSVEIDSGDVETAIRDVRSHGYGLTDSNQRLLLLINETQSEHVQSWRAGQENANSQISKYDFIPAINQPSFVLQGGGQLVGNQPSGEVFKLPSVGSYGPAAVIESQFVPAGYFALVSSAGPGSDTNVVGVRQWPEARYQGLRQLPGNQTGYPLESSFYTRAFGVGARHRGAAIVYQLKASGPYEAPEIL